MSSSETPAQSTADVSNRTFLIVSVTLTCISSVFILARLIASWQRKAKKHSEHIDDYVIVIAFAFLVGSVAGYNKLILALLDPTMTLQSLMTLSNALTWVGSLMLWGCKIPILLLYITLFGVKTWLKLISYGTILVSGTIFLIVSAYVTSQCTGKIDASLLPRCQVASTRAGFTLGIVSVLTDAIIIALPLPVILRMHLPLGRRIGVAVVFGTGLAAFAASIISTNYKYDAMKWSTSTGTNAMICTIVECAVALIAACVPSVYGLWSRNFVGSSFYSQISSALSQVFSTKSSRSRSGASDSSIRSNKSQPRTVTIKTVDKSHHESERRSDVEK